VVVVVVVVAVVVVVGGLDSDEAKTCSKRTRNKYKPKTETRTTPSNQTRRQAGGFS